MFLWFFSSMTYRHNKRLPEQWNMISFLAMYVHKNINQGKWKVFSTVFFYSLKVTKINCFPKRSFNFSFLFLLLSYISSWFCYFFLSFFLFFWIDIEFTMNFIGFIWLNLCTILIFTKRFCFFVVCFKIIFFFFC